MEVQSQTNKISRHHLWGWATRRTAAYFCRTAFYRWMYSGGWGGGDSNILGGADQRSHAACLSAQMISSHSALVTVTLRNRVLLEEAEPGFIRPVCSIAFSTFALTGGRKDSIWHLTYRAHVYVEIYMHVSIHRVWKYLFSKYWGKKTICC